MLAAIDVQYDDPRARAACVTFASWESAAPLAVVTAEIAEVRDYEPGQFYKRELPCVMAVLDKLPERPEVVVVDGYVWLGTDRPGLGKHLYDALGGAIPVVGVAKNRFAGAPGVSVLRGRSTKPLWVTSEGLEVARAVEHVASMHGEHRFPTLLLQVDHAARGQLAPTVD